MQRGSAAWIARRCATGCIGLTNFARRASRQLAEGLPATLLGRAASGISAGCRDRSGPRMASCAGGASICNASSASTSASSTLSAQSASSSRRSASRASAHVRATRGRTRGRPRRLKKLRGRAERPSGQRQEGQTIEIWFPDEPSIRHSKALRASEPLAYSARMARRTGSSADGRDAERGRASLPTGALTVPKNMTLIFLPSRSPELNPVENIWRYLRANWLSNRVFESYDAIIDAACAAWRNLIARPQTITSIGMRDRAHIGQSCGPLASNAACDFRRLYII